MSALRLEDFAGNPAEPTNETHERDRLATFETGYREGWEDAIKDAVETRDRIRRTLSARLEDLSFTYHEARTGLLAQLDDVVAAIADAVMPRLSSEGFAARLAAAIRDEVGDEAPGPIELRVCEADLPAVREVLDVPDALPVELIADRTLEAGQAVFAFGPSRRKIDHTRLAETASRILRESLATPPERTAHRA